MDSIKKHCTNCKYFTWWDGDYCCMAQMKVIVESQNGYFWCPFPQSFQKVFDAEDCSDYTYEENNIYSEPYNDFLKELQKNGDENLSLEKYKEKYYKKTLIKPTEN